MNIATAYWQGMGMGASLIVAIGAQNAFVLTQGIRRNYPLAVAGLCAVLDILLIAAGVCGLGRMTAENETLNSIATLGGALFLFCLGGSSLAKVFKHDALSADNAAVKGLRATLTATLAVSLLNPHVYLDTVVMLGAISGNYAGFGRYAFGAGAATASLVWFFSLGFAGGLLAPLLAKARGWQILNLLVCLTVWWIAASLLWGYYEGGFFSSCLKLGSASV